MPYSKPLSARWFTAAAARLTYLSGVGYVAMAYTVSRFLTKPRRRLIASTPADRGLPFENVQIVTEDGVALAGWFVDAPAARGTVALFHGMRQNRQQVLARIEFLRSAGYRCLAIDHRAHGESSGKRVSCGWYEARDVNAAAKWIAERYPDEPRLALGISMGAAAICFAGSSCGWSRIVLEGVYTDLSTAFKRRIGAMYPRWFAELYPAVYWITQKRLRVRIQQISPTDAIKGLGRTPILAIAGDRDLLAPPSDVRAVASAAAAPVSTWIVPGAGHNDMCETGGDAYQRCVLDFLAAA